jgi:hypothetical protein
LYGGLPTIIILSLSSKLYCSLDMSNRLLCLKNVYLGNSFFAVQIALSSISAPIAFLPLKKPPYPHDVSIIE